MKKKTLRKSDIRHINDEIQNSFGIDSMFDKKETIEEITDEFKMIVKDSVALFFYSDEKLVPTLRLCLENDSVLKKITVDMGAVRFVTSGADIMRPGITNLEDDIEKDDFVMIVDENNKKPLAVAKTMFSGEEMNTMDTGKVLKNIHFIGDKIWEMKF